MSKKFLLLCFLIQSISGFAQMATTNLLGYYPFTGNTNDSSGNGNNGTLIGATLTTDQYGNTNSACHFDGNDRIDCGNDASVNFASGDFTIQAWFNTNTTSGRQDIISKQATTLGIFGSYGLRLETGVPTFTIRKHCCSNHYTTIAGSSAIAPNSWHQMVGVGDSTAGVMRLYMDGVLLDSASWNGILYSPANFNLLIGAFFKDDAAGDYLGYFNGDIDEVKIYKQALSSAEIAQGFYSSCVHGTVTNSQKISDTQGGFGGTLDNSDRFLGAVGIGDLNNDGVIDLAVGAHGDDDGSSNRGAVWILFMNANGTVASEQKISSTQGNLTGVLGGSDQFGISLAPLGDLNNDGNPDLAVGAFGDDDGGSDHGAVYILFLDSNGTVGSFQKISDTQGNFTGTLTNNNRFGENLTNLGDIDNDGVTDIAVGLNKDVDGGTGRGAVWVVRLNNNGTVKAAQKISDTQGGFTGTLDNGDEFGRVAGIGDINGDGFLDLAVGACNDDDGGTNTGAVWLLHLDSTGQVLSHNKISDTQGNFNGTLDAGDCFGFSVSAIGDLNNDGYTEIAVCADQDDDGGTDKGAVWVLFMDANGNIDHHEKISATSGNLSATLDNDDRFGAHVHGIGDLNGDYIPDIAVGARLDDDGGSDVGAVYILNLCGVPMPPAVAGNATRFEHLWGTDSSDVSSHSFPLPDGGLGVVGRTNAGGNRDVWFMRLNELGDTVFVRTYGTTAAESGTAGATTNDGGYILTGTRNGSGFGNDDALLIKLDSNGNEQWSKYYGHSNQDRGFKVIQTNDGGYAFAGQTSLGPGGLASYLVKTDASGNISWTKAYGQNGFDAAYDLIETSDNGIVTAGEGWGNNLGLGVANGLIVKFSSTGTVLWQKVIGSNGEDYLFAVTETSDQGIAVAGYSQSFGAGLKDMFVSKLSASGTVLWSKAYGGTGGESALSIKGLSDGGLIIAGTTESFGLSSFDNYVVRTDSLGDTLWTRTFGTVANSEGGVFGLGAAGPSISYSTNGGFWLTSQSYGTGPTGDDTYLVKMDDQGHSPGCGEHNTTTTVTSVTALIGTTASFSSGGSAANLTVTTSSPLFDRQVFCVDSTISNGCPVSAQMNIPSDKACLGTTVVFNGSSSGASGYAWLVNGLQETTADSLTFTPTTLGTYTVELIATDGLCADTVDTIITVHTLPTAFQATFANQCIDNPVLTLTNGFPAGGTYAGSNVTSGTFDPATAGVGTHSIYYTYTDTNNCMASDTVSIEVFASPAVTLTGIGPFCSDAPAQTLSGSPAGGTYSGPGVSGNNFYPALAASGTHAVQYDYTDGNGCSSSTTISVIVNSLPVVSLSVQSDICADASPQPITGASPAGGVFSGPGVTGSNFDPAVAGVGTHTITYTATNTNGCSDSATAAITVNALPALQFLPWADVCADATAFTATGGFPAGGIYSGNGMTGTTFTPSNAGAGQHVITYTVTDANGCSNNDFTSVTVDSIPFVTLPALPDQCMANSAFNLNQGNPAGGSYSGNGVSGSNFIPSVAGMGNHPILYVFTDSNGCASSSFSAISVNAQPMVTLAAQPDLCADVTAVQPITGATPGGGMFSGNGVVSNGFDPVIAGIGTHSIIYIFVDSNGCSGSDSTSVTVYPLPAVDLGADTTFCAGTSLVLDAGNGFNNYQWSDGSAAPTLLVDSTGNYSVIVTDPQLCVNSDSIQVTVNALPLPLLGPDTTVVNGDSILLFGGIFQSYLWTGGSTDSTLEVNTSGTYALNVVDENGCRGSDAIEVTIWPVGIEETPIPVNLKIYPNPTQGLLQFESETSLPASFEVIIFNASGQRVPSRVTNQTGNAFQIDLSQAARGVYFMEMRWDGQKISRRIIRL